MTVNGSTAFEYPIEALEKSSGGMGGWVTIPSQGKGWRMSLTSWIFKQIKMLPREKDPFIFKMVNCISRKWNSRAQIKAVVIFLRHFLKTIFQDKRCTSPQARKTKQSQTKHPHIRSTPGIF